MLDCHSLTTSDHLARYHGARGSLYSTLARLLASPSSGSQELRRAHTDLEYCQSMLLEPVEPLETLARVLVERADVLCHAELLLHRDPKAELAVAPMNEHHGHGHKAGLLPTSEARVVGHWPSTLEQPLRPSRVPLRRGVLERDFDCSAPDCRGRREALIAVGLDPQGGRVSDLKALAELAGMAHGCLRSGDLLCASSACELQSRLLGDHAAACLDTLAESLRRRSDELTAALGRALSWLIASDSWMITRSS
jgi:hypothetical protein